MKTHKWHRIAPEVAYDDDPCIWEWCSLCGSMRLGCEVFYIGDSKMRSNLDQGCPDFHINTDKQDKGIFEQVSNVAQIDPFELPDETK